MTTELSKFYEESYKRSGVQGLTTALDSSVNTWKDVEINIAVTGETGSGKSSFINAIRDLNADDKGSAQVGVTETTKECSKFLHPSNEKFIVWDLPGVGTKEFPKETYFEKICIDRYDFFIIISSKRITENDIWLANQIEKQGRRFYFVRSRIASDIKNKRKSKRKKLTKEEEVALEKEVYDEVYNHCKKQLERFKSKTNIFIIDSYEKAHFDFKLLKAKMISDTVKKEAMIFTLTAATEEAIAEKKSLLEKRIWSKALRAALAPGLCRIDEKILREELEFYKKQFGLDRKTLARDFKASQIEEKLMEFMEKTESDDNDLMSSECLKEINSMIPFLPPIVNQVQAFGYSKQWLKEALDLMTNTSLEALRQITTGLVGARSMLDDVAQ